MPLVGFTTGFGFASFGVLISAIAKSIDNFNYVTSAVITPLFLVAGTFFPISALPDWAGVASQFNPLYHCVQLVRHAVFDDWGLVDLWNFAALALFAVAMWGLAVWRLRLRLVD